MASMWDLLNEKVDDGSNKYGLYSLDIETTGINKNEDRIWSIGLDSYEDRSKSLERFIGDVVPRNTQNLPKDFIDANTKGTSKAFGQSQYQSGAFNPYFEAANTNKLTTVSNVLNEMSEVLKQKPGIMLIQNTPFETGFFANQTGNPFQGVTEATNKKFSGEILGYEDASKPLFMDPRDRPIRDNFQKLFQERFLGDVIKGEDVVNDDATKALVKASRELESTIVKRIQSQHAKGKSAVTELMDFSRMYLTDLHIQGGIDSNYLRLGQNVNFLAETLLGVSESHTALLDAKQQSEILKKISERRENIKNTGSLQQEDLDFIKRLTSPNNTVGVFKKSVSSELQGLDNKKYQKASDKQKHLLFQERLKAVRDNHITTNTGNFDKQGYLDDIEAKYKAGTPLADLVGQAIGTETGATSSYKPQGDSQASDVAAKAKKPTQGLLKDISEGFSKLSAPNKALTVGLGALAVGSLTSGPRRDKEDTKRNIQQSTYNDLYDNVYAGQAYADWTVRNQANKMIY